MQRNKALDYSEKKRKKKKGDRMKGEGAADWETADPGPGVLQLADETPGRHG